MNKYAKLYLTELQQKTGGVGSTLLQEAPVIAKGLGTAAKSVGTIAQDAGKSLWSNSRGLLNSASSFVANKTKPITSAIDNLNPATLSPGTPGLGAQSKSVRLDQMQKALQKNVNESPSTPFFRTSATEPVSPTAAPLPTKPGAAVTPNELQKGLNLSRGSELPARPDIAANKNIKMQEPNNLPEHVQPASAREAELANKAKPTLDPAATPEPVGPVKDTAKPLANKGLFNSPLPGGAVFPAGAALLAGGAALTNNMIPNLSTVNQATKAAPVATATGASVKPDNPLSQPFNKGPGQVPELAKVPTMPDDTIPVASSSRHRSAPIAAPAPAPQAPAAQPNVRQNSSLPGIFGTLSNAVGRAGDTAVHAASGNLGQHQNYRQTSFLPHK